MIMPTPHRLSLLVTNSRGEKVQTPAVDVSFIVASLRQDIHSETCARTLDKKLASKHSVGPYQHTSLEIITHLAQRIIVVLVWGLA